jgi:putative acyl-CoA dehydrogenase
MCDAFLTLAQTEAGLTCFLAPRWRPDGAKNGIEFIRLKRKMGNVSNASSETEWRGALGWRVGPDGRGVATIIEMVAMTRFDCMIGSSAGMRRAVSEAIDHCRQRRAFGALLWNQPIMRDVLADLAVESEAALLLTMRIARALDHHADRREDRLVRLGAPLGKYWICKRAPMLAYEAMECIGGSGAMEDSPMPRLYREAPINAIWEGSGNVQCLDVLRAIQKSPDALDAYFDEVLEARGGDRALDAHVERLKDDLKNINDFEAHARDICDRMALGLQASVVVRHAPPAVADAYCVSRLSGRGAHHYGAFSRSVDSEAIVRRAAART